ncbi:MAG TPA: nuclear transport factor 2 family protein [Candidatus Sulfotelmatobacter sp.]|jgi:hypothetical protein|nr:nuclear transport factor 2 family protein [Candidatus Sulfotelmatobacter sp.]
MKRNAAILALLVSLVSTAAAQAKQPANVSRTDASAVEVHVRKLWEAFKKKDKATLASLLDDRFRMFEEGLATFGDKKAEVSSPDEYELLSYTLSDFTVTPIGPDTALVTYLAQYEGKSGGEMLKGKSVFGEIWLRSGGDWKALYLQETYVK